MELNRFKVMCKESFFHFDSILKKNDIVTLIVYGYDKDTLLVHPTYKLSKDRREYILGDDGMRIEEPGTKVIAKKGSYKEMAFLMPDGRIIPESVFMAIGYNWLDMLFVKAKRTPEEAADYYQYLEDPEDRSALQEEFGQQGIADREEKFYEWLTFHQSDWDVVG